MRAEAPSLAISPLHPVPGYRLTVEGERTTAISIETEEPAMTDTIQWVPLSCTLPTEQQPLRLAEFDALFAASLRAASRPEPLRLRLHLAGGPGMVERVQDLADRESSCCSFFTFAVGTEHGTVVLDVEVDPAHSDVLDSLQARAVAAAGLDTP